MHHFKGNTGQNFDIEWDGQTAELSINGAVEAIDLLPDGPSKCHILKDHKSYSTEILEFNHEAKTARVKVNGTVYQLSIKDRFDDLLQSLGMEGGATKKIKEVKAPMPGMVLDVLVAPGQTVTKDTPLLILEAMKMENVIKSPADGVIKKAVAIKGVAVEKNAILLEFE